jgi:hypothetical protein
MPFRILLSGTSQYVMSRMSRSAVRLLVSSSGRDFRESRQRRVDCRKGLPSGDSGRHIMLKS